MTPRAVILLIGALSAAALVGAFALQTRRADGLARQVARFEACEAAVVGKPKARPAAEVCSKAIAAADADADRERACSAALAAENTFAIRMVCGTATKALFAQREAARGELSGVKAELANEQAGREGDLRRAQTAGKAEAERKARRDAAVQAAPRDAAGLVVCDDECLRSRW